MSPIRTTFTTTDTRARVKALPLLGPYIRTRSFAVTLTRKHVLIFLQQQKTEDKDIITM